MIFRPRCSTSSTSAAICTLLPGDMISGGSGPGSATDTDKDLGTGEDITHQAAGQTYLKVGDVVELSSPSIGVLRNRVIAQAPS